jgi:glycosyltransferase involved in cell wall biosynthesis
MFSVVVPCFGHEKFLPTVIESIWAQTFRDFEIVVVNDGSPDGSASVLASLASRSPTRMRVVTTVNAGAHAALNAGAELAAGRYLAFANDDDAFHPERLEVFARAIRLCDAFAWGFSAVEPMNEDGDLIDASAVPDLTRRLAIELSTVPLEALRGLPRRNTAVSSGNLVVRRDLFLDAGGFRDLRFAHDWELNLRLLAKATPYIAERRLYRYRVHTGNAFAAQSSREGAHRAEMESALIIQAQRGREEAQDASEPRVRYLPKVDPDEAFAIKLTLWMMGMLRSRPRLYRAVRTTARIARKARRH